MTTENQQVGNGRGAVATREPSEFEKLLERDGKKMVEFTPYGGADKIKLTPKLVQDLICIPTKSGRVCSERDAIRFMMLCVAKRLNPFDGDAYLQGYDGKDGPVFSLITAHQAYLKRSEMHPEFDGFESGAILVDKETGDESEVQGDYYDRKKKTLVGGWCRVHTKNRKIPILKRLALDVFTPKWGGSRWEIDSAGMIVKCAEADALRTLAPTMLGGMYLREEIDFDLSGNTSRQDQTFATVSRTDKPAPTAAADPAEADFQPAQPAREVAQPKREKEPVLKPQDELCKIIIGEGFNFEKFMDWAVDTGQYNDTDRDKIIDFDAVPTKDAERFVKAKAGLLAGLKKGGVL